RNWVIGELGNWDLEIEKRWPERQLPTYQIPQLPNARVLLLGDVLHASGLALQVAQVIQLGAADLGRAGHFHLLDGRRVQRKDPLDTLAERHLADGERGSRAAAVDADHD